MYVCMYVPIRSIVVFETTLSRSMFFLTKEEAVRDDSTTVRIFFARWSRKVVAVVSKDGSKQTCLNKTSALGWDLTTAGRAN